MKDSPSFWSRLDAVDILVSVTSLAILVVIVSVQVFCRYVLQNSLDWTEELAVICSSGPCFSDAATR